MNTTQQYSDRELIALIKNKQEAGFSEVYGIYGAALYGIILRMVPDQSRAAVVLEETFVLIWLHIAEYEPSRCSLFTWMIQLAMAGCRQAGKSLPGM